MLTIPSLLTSPEAHPLVLHMLCLRKFGVEYLGWEPETIWQEFGTEYKVTISQLNKSKIQACRTVHLTTAPYEDWYTFEKVVCPMSFIAPQFAVMQRPSVLAITQGVWAMQTLRGGAYSPDVEKYIAGILLDEGFLYPPKDLEFVVDRMKSAISPELYESMRKVLLSPANYDMPSDPQLAIQVLKHKEVSSYLTEYQRAYKEQLDVIKL